MNNRVKIVSVMLIISLLVGCGDRMELEKLTLTLSFAMDINDKGDLMIYQTNPVFSKEAKEKTDTITTKATSLREARNHLDSMSNGRVAEGKMQVIVIGKKFLKQYSPFPYLDYMFRNPKSAVNARIVAVDGPVSEVMNFSPKDKPRLAIFLTRLIDTSYRNEQTALTSFHSFFSQMFEKGMTPSISEITKGKDEVQVVGTTLLDQNGKYATSLNHSESSLMVILQENINFPIPLTIMMPIKKGNKTDNDQKISFDIKNIHYDITTDYQNDHFQYDIKLNMDIILSERTFALNFLEKNQEIKSLIEHQLKKEFSALVTKVQKQQLDPFGLGKHARAFQYSQWKKVKNDWGKAFSKAEVEITPVVNIKSFGVIK